MTDIIIGIFIILHGLVHLLYAGHSLRLFELTKDLSWPDGSWIFSRILSTHHTQKLAGLTIILAAAGFAVGGAARLFSFDWWIPIVVVSAIYAVALTILFWDGKFQRLADQGGVGMLIDIALALLIIALG